MAKKSQTKKTTTTKSKSKSAKNKTTKSSRTSKSTNVNQQASAVDYRDLFYGTISALAVYVFALWAIDSGSLWVYGFTFAALYYTIHFYRLFIRNKFFNNDKTRKAKKA